MRWSQIVVVTSVLAIVLLHVVWMDQGERYFLNRKQILVLCKVQHIVSNSLVIGL